MARPLPQSWPVRGEDGADLHGGMTPPTEDYCAIKASQSVDPKSELSTNTT